ncbi:MAG: hypothetical protein KDJ27_04220 [Gammaproteobacteria bacterium]|nr:hypothetical protein [Gammaproteobacteria bacterium]
MRLLFTVVCLLLFAMSDGIAGIDKSLDEQLNILAQGKIPERLIPGAQYRVAVFSYNDPDDTGLGDTLAAIAAREVLTNSKVSSIGVIFFKGGVAPSGDSKLGYFDKVEKVTAAQDVKLAVWGIIRTVGDQLEILTYAQVPRPALEQHFTWRLRMPEAMGGQSLLARLRPDRILVQRLLLDADGVAALRRGADAIARVRSAPRNEAPVKATLPMDRVYYIVGRKNDWVHLQAAGGVDGWAPVRGQCTGACGEFLQAATYAGGVLRYMADGEVPAARGRFTDEARAVADQLGALGLLARGTLDDLHDLQRVIRPWLQRKAVPPGGAAFANIQALAELALALKEEYLSHAGHGTDAAEKDALYNQIQLSKRGARDQAYALAKISLSDPRNPDLLHNLAVLFAYAGDGERADLARQLAETAITE